MSPSRVATRSMAQRSRSRSYAMIQGLPCWCRKSRAALDNRVALPQPHRSADLSWLASFGRFDSGGVRVRRRNAAQHHPEPPTEQADSAHRRRPARGCASNAFAIKLMVYSKNSSFTFLMHRVSSIRHPRPYGSSGGCSRPQPLCMNSHWLCLPSMALWRSISAGESPGANRGGN
jgi:hypothetical protein